MAILKLKNKTTGEWEEIQAIKGDGIDRIEKTATVGNKDTYTIYFTNGSTTTYEVSNGEVTREELEEEVERLSMIYNAFPSTTGEGEEASINGTAEVPFKEIGLKGNTSQESTTGKNLFDISKVITNETALVNNGNGTITVTTASNNSQVIAGEPRKLKDYCPNLQVGDSVYLTANSTGTSKYIYLATTAQVWTFGTQRTITQNDLDSTVGWYASGVSTTATISDIMVSTSGGDYEPYTNGPAPNPDYPYPVNVVSGDNTIKVEGKNLANFPTGATLPRSTGQEIVVDFGKDVTIDRFTLSFIMENAKLANGSAAVVDFRAEDGTHNYRVGRHYDMETNTTLNGTYSRSETNMTFRYVYVFLGTGYANFAEGKCSIQFEYGNATTYEPYQSQTYPINLGSMELCKIGDYQDSIVKDNGKWYLNKQIGKVVLDGSETWYRWTTNVFYITKLTEIRNALSNYYTYNSTATGGGQLSNGEFFIHDNTNNNVVVFKNTVIDDSIDSFKTWLSTHNTTVYYVLATPTATEITDTTLIEQLDNLEKAYSYDTQTNISQTNQDKPFIISYEAILSLRNVLNNLETRIAVLETE